MAVCEIRIRYVIAIACFIGVFLNYSVKNVTNLTLVAMNKNDSTEISMSVINDSETSTNLNTSLSSENSTVPTISPIQSNVINWDHKTRNMVQGAFFYGYIILQLPSGRISELIGTRSIFGPAILVACLLSFLFPYAAQSGSLFACLVRFFQGLCLGVSFPSMHSLISQWAPINERSMLVSLIYSGSSMGLVTVEVASGYLSASSFLGGWPSMYFIIGCCGLVWFIFWILFVYDKPELHPMITEDELAFINNGRNKSLNTKVTISSESLLNLRVSNYRNRHCRYWIS